MEDQLQELKNYIESLGDNRSISHNITTHDGIDSTKDEFIRSIQVLKIERHKDQINYT